MNFITPYSAPPDNDRFRKIDAAQLAEIIREIREAEQSSVQTEWSRDVWECDIEAATHAAELMDSEGATILHAQDEDGHYFAVGAPIIADWPRQSACF